MKQPHSEAARTGGATPSSIRPRSNAGRSGYAGVSFEIPNQEAVEAMVVAFRTPSGSALPAASVSITRERMREGDSLRTHTDRVLSRLGREAENFDLLESRTVDVGGRTAQQLHFTWTNHLGEMDQTMILVEPGEDRDRRVVAINVVGPRELAEETMKVFEELLRTMRFEAPRGEASADAAPPAPESSHSVNTGPRTAPTLPPPAPPPSRGPEHTPGPVIPMPGYRDR